MGLVIIYLWFLMERYIRVSKFERLIVKREGSSSKIGDGGAAQLSRRPPGGPFASAQ